MRNFRKKVDACNVFDDLEVIALYEHSFRSCLTEIRENLDDRFKRFFDTKLARSAALYQLDAKRVSEIQKLEDFIRNILTSKTLDVLCIHSNKVELDRVRTTLDNGEVAISRAILRFISRFGDWTDVRRILTLSQRRHFSATIALWLATDEWAKPIAQALHALGKSRLVDLLQLEVDNSISGVH